MMIYLVVSRYLLHERRLLFKGAVLEKLLDDIVAEDVRHEAVSLSGYLLENGTLLGRGGALQLLLYEARAMLILRELHHVPGQVAQLNRWVAVVSARRMPRNEYKGKAIRRAFPPGRPLTRRGSRSRFSR